MQIINSIEIYSVIRKKSYYINKSNMDLKFNYKKIKTTLGKKFDIYFIYFIHINIQKQFIFYCKQNNNLLKNIEIKFQ